MKSVGLSPAAPAGLRPTDAVEIADVMGQMTDATPSLVKKPKEALSSFYAQQVKPLKGEKNELFY